MATVTETASKTIRDYAEPAFATVRENATEIRRAIAASRETAEACATEARAQLRRYPFASLGIAIGLGAIVGCIVGFTAGRQSAR